jgi:long-chain acyl-CoA synthetase
VGNRRRSRSISNRSCRGPTSRDSTPRPPRSPTTPKSALIDDALETVNSRYAQVEQIKRFAILDHDRSQEAGELTPTLKVKRHVVNERCARVFELLYS